jgi:hypothetical protein
MCKFFFFFPSLPGSGPFFFFSRVCQTPDFSNSLFRVIILTTPWLRAVVVAHAFESYKMFANYRQTSMGFVVFVGYGFRGTAATHDIAAQLEQCIDYTPTNIFLNVIMQKPESKDIMQACQNMKKEMLLNRCKIFTAYLYTLRRIQQMLREPWLEEQTMDTLVTYLTPMYDQYTVDAIKTAVNSATRELRNTKQSKLFLWLMNSKWMLQNG